MNPEAVLEIKNLSVSIDTEEGEVQAVRGVSLSLSRGEILAVVGESGCGKSMLCKSILQILPGNARIRSGEIFIDGMGLSELSEKDLCSIRGKLCAMVFQDPVSVMDPTISVGRQIGETIQMHEPQLTRSQRRARVIELMELVGIENAEKRADSYPHQLSGGQRQRCVLAAALANSPQVLIADEPTSALDVSVQDQILSLLLDIRERTGIAILFVTHDLRVMSRIADRVAIMYAGRIAEIGTTSEILNTPAHPYTWGLLQALPEYAADGRLRPIAGSPPSLIHPPQGDAFAQRNPYAMAIDYEKQPPFFELSPTHQAATWLLDPRAPKVERPVFASADHDNWHKHIKEKERPVLLEVSHISHTYRLDRRNILKAVDDVSFHIGQGEIYGLVGESGCGKSTVARCILDIYPIHGGSIIYDGSSSADKAQKKLFRQKMQKECQIILQDSSVSMNHRMKIKDIVAEPIRLQGMIRDRVKLEEYVEEMLAEAGISADYMDCYPHQLSGGQRQRVSIARAFAAKPRLLIADEPLASLDVSVQAQIVGLFHHLAIEHETAVLFIAHDLSMVRFLCDRVGIMRGGRLVQEMEAQELVTI